MSEPRVYSVNVTIRTEMWLNEDKVYNDEGWISPDFAQTVLQGLFDDYMERWLRPSDITHLHVEEITHALG